MNIETKIDSRLWQYIQSSYGSNSYSNAILDAIHFMGNLIREKTGLEEDGTALIGKAFGGKNPKLRLNNLQTETEKNIQGGLEQILRGIYQCIRNPRSHKKFNDTKEEADTIILFINYLINEIDKSKTKFVRKEFIERVFDKDFVKKQRYAELLINEIPLKQRFDVFIDIYSEKEKGNIYKIPLFLRELFEKLEKEDKNKVFQMVSGELKKTSSNTTIEIVIGTFGSNYWGSLDEAARLRIENKIIVSVEDGWFNTEEGTCSKDGNLGTWGTRIFNCFTLKEEMIQAILKKLRSGNSYEEDYVFRFLFDNIFLLADPPTSSIVVAIGRGLRKGDMRFHSGLRNIFDSGAISWIETFEKLYEDFDPKGSIPDDDDIPF